MPRRNLIAIVSFALVSLVCYEKARYSRYAAVVADAMGQIVDRYVEPVDRRSLFEGAMEGMLGRLDEYSGYVDEQALRQLYESIIEQEFGGVGIEVGVDPDTNRLTVLSPLVNTPAYKAGMKAGDVILEIDGKNAEGIALNEAVKLMRGEPDSEVRLRVLHLGEETPLELVISRAVINVESAVGDTRSPDGQWHFRLKRFPHIGYIRLTTFGENTAEELARALQFDGQPVDGLILDIRENAGGLLEVAADVCDLFIDEGQIVTTRDRNGNVERAFWASPETTAFRLPLAVLVDRYSASASEIVAACMQDHKRAKIVGQRTWGKGTVQNVIPLEGGRSAMKLTTATYWRPSGMNIHRSSQATEDDDWGVHPDKGYEVVLTDEQYKKLIEAYRNRYIAGSKTPRPEEDGPPTGDADDTSPKADRVNSEGEFEDPQLRKAIEYIENRRQKATDSLPNNADGQATRSSRPEFRDSFERERESSHISLYLCQSTQPET